MTAALSGRTTAPRKRAVGAARAARPRLRSGRAGLTLIEIMVVVVIVALAASGASLGLGVLTRAGLRSASIQMIALSRYAYHRALTKGTTVRLTLDMAAHTVGLSEAHGRVTLVRSDAPLREAAARDLDEDEERPSAALDPWEMAKKRLEEPDVLRFPPSPFSAITAPSGAAIKRFSTHPLGDGIEIVKVVVAHEAEPREEGTTDLFYFPGGLTQHAVVQLRDRLGTIFSVEIHPLTGHATVHDVPFEPEVLMDDPTARDEDTNEVEDSL
jgi:prepilin-type N-terminal cleavage/methylation domain-containing protein